MVNDTAHNATKGAANKTVQDKMSELSELVAWFQGPEFTLEKALDTYKQAEVLAEDIEKDLAELKNEITVVKQKFDANGGGNNR